MSSNEEARLAQNPIHVVGVLTAKELVAARYDALRPFHMGLDEADRNLRNLLPGGHRKTTIDRGDGEGSEFVVTDESASYDLAQAEPHGSSGPAPSVPFELWSPWVTDVDAADVPQAA